MSNLTPSAFTRLEKCIGGAVLPNVTEEYDSARKGKAVHDFLRRLARGEIRADALKAIDQEFVKDCERMEIPERVSKGAPEVGLALNVATGAARVLGEDMTREQVRAAKMPGETGMLLDWVADAGHILVVDYKAGWQEDLGPASEHLQLLVYTATALLAFGKEEARGELWHWDGVRWRVDGVTLDFLGALEVLDRVRGLLARAEEARAAYEKGAVPRLAIGKWCAWCPAQRACPARTSAAVVALRYHLPHVGGAPMTPEEAGAAYLKLKGLKAWVEQGLSDLEGLAAQTPLPLPDGTVLRQQEREVTRIEPAAAEDWLRKTFGDAAAGAAVETRVVMTWEGLKDALRTQVLPEQQRAHAEGRLQGRKPTLAALVQQARSGLEAVGAVQVSSYTTTRPVRPELPSGEEGKNGD